MSGSLRVAVLMGGPSAEHDISLKSGHGVVNALIARRWPAEPVVIPKALSVKSACSFAQSALRAQRADVAFIAVHGAFGEDGTIQQVCEALRIPYTGSDPVASRLGMDKIASRKRFEEAGLLVPRWQVIDAGDRRSAARARYAYPLMVKPASQGSSLGVCLVKREEGLADALKTAGRYGPQVLVEEFVAGHELTVGILDEEPLPIVEIRPHQPFFDFTAKYTAGSTDYLVPAPLAPPVAKRVQAAGLTAHRALGCRHLSRADIILNRDEEPVLLEINTIPGFTPTSLLPKAAACAHLSYEALCERLVEMAWQGSAAPVSS